VFIPVVEEQVKDLSFQQWLGSVTERINQTMHYQFDGELGTSYLKVQTFLNIAA